MFFHRVAQKTAYYIFLSVAKCPRNRLMSPRRVVTGGAIIAPISSILAADMLSSLITFCYQSVYITCLTRHICCVSRSAGNRCSTTSCISKTTLHVCRHALQHRRRFTYDAVVDQGTDAHYNTNTVLELLKNAEGQTGQRLQDREVKDRLCIYFFYMQNL